MDKKIHKINSVDYKRIYQEIIKRKYPDIETQCKNILAKDQLSTRDVIRINILISKKECKEVNVFNQNHRSYDLRTILQMLEYQKNNNLNNTQLAIHFQLSRNTVAKWKKYFSV
ncbi:helix-turn-helix domain-containing protein [Chryseobacterium sp. EZn1]|uniref:helix-turn-helix domain-containing protein n=1 Tax=Chryseobacterium cupriresistens TaxID=3366770 RepID=UPI003984ED08